MFQTAFWFKTSGKISYNVKLSGRSIKNRDNFLRGLVGGGRRRIHYSSNTNTDYTVERVAIDNQWFPEIDSLPKLKQATRD